MERKEVQKFLMGQLALLRKAHVDDLMRTRRHKEVESVLKDVPLDFSPIKKFCNEGDAVYLQGEIPEGMPLYELIAYMKQSGLDDDCFVEDDSDLQYLLSKTGEEVLEDIATLNESYNIGDCTMRELLEKPEEKE